MADMFGSINGFLMGIDVLPVAYVGPGAGLTFIGALIAVLVGVLLVIVGVFAWPFRMLWRKIRGKKSSPATQETDASQNSDEQATSEDQGEN